jgi:dolichol-phosphate mannosyltransferase
MMKKLSIILPTLNEEKNIKKIAYLINKTFKKDLEIIFIDDNSNDCTQNEIVQISKKFKNIKYKFRKKRNLSTAFLDGLKLSSGQNILLMDSDLQHDPSNIKNIYSKLIKSNLDMIIGSRFLEKSINYKSGFKKKFRLMLSRIFCFIFGIFYKPSISDPLSGFFIAKKKILLVSKRLLFKRGFKVVLDYYFVLGKKINIGEIPIKMNKRNSGNSKLNFKILMLIFNQIYFHTKFKFY